MRIHREIEIIYPMFVVKLDSGVSLTVFDGYALGSDKNIYYHVGKEDENGILQTVGWSCDIDCEIIIE